MFLLAVAILKKVVNEGKNSYAIAVHYFRLL